MEDALFFWIILIAIAYKDISRLFAPSKCNHNCNQGRNCTCK